MPLTDEQAATVKEQLLKQADALPEEQREKIISYISSMDAAQLEQFLIKNKMLRQKTGAGSKVAPKGAECVFCLISAKQLEAFTLYEDKEYAAVLEIKPFSQGHTVLIPKKHIKETKSLPAKAFTIANKIGKRLIKQLKAETFHITTSAELNHAIVNIIPAYKNQPLTYERKPAEKRELQELAIKIGEIGKRESKAAKPVSSKTPSLKISKEKAEQAVIKLQRRIP